MVERLREHIPNDPKQTYGHTRALQVTSKVYGVNVGRPSPNIVSALFINEDSFTSENDSAFDLWSKFSF